MFLLLVNIITLDYSVIRETIHRIVLYIFVVVSWLHLDSNCILKYIEYRAMEVILCTMYVCIIVPSIASGFDSLKQCWLFWSAHACIYNTYISMYFRTRYILHLQGSQLSLHLHHDHLILSQHLHNHLLLCQKGAVQYIPEPPLPFFSLEYID